MKTNLLLLSVLLVATSVVLAFPPAPHHTFMGQVRDEFGNPITGADATVTFTASSGRTIKTSVNRDIAPGVNYRLSVPMDAGLTSELHKPTAMRPTLPFTMKVEIGGVTYLPIEIAGKTASMGVPGETTILNLTLGVDSDNDGLPDAWEQGLIDALSHLKNLSDVNPGDDSDGDGLSNLAEYISGNYAFDDSDGFDLKVKIVDGKAVVEWLAIRGRTYSVVGSVNIKSWSPVPMVLSSDEDSISRDSFLATDVRKIEAVIDLSNAEPGLKFFRLQVQ